MKSFINDNKSNIENISKASFLEVKEDILKLVKNEIHAIKTYIDDMNTSMATEQGTNEESLFIIKDEMKAHIDNVKSEADLKVNEEVIEMKASIDDSESNIESILKAGLVEVKEDIKLVNNGMALM